MAKAAAGNVKKKWLVNARVSETITREGMPYFGGEPFPIEKLSKEEFREMVDSGALHEEGTPRPAPRAGKRRSRSKNDDLIEDHDDWRASTPKAVDPDEDDDELDDDDDDLDPDEGEPDDEEDDLEEEGEMSIPVDPFVDKANDRLEAAKPKRGRPKGSTKAAKAAKEASGE